MTTPLSHTLGRSGPAILFATSIPLFLGALLADWAYSSTYVIQWVNFASWLNAGALVIAGAALLWAFVRVLRNRSFQRDRRAWLCPGLMAAAFVVGFINALVHAKDAWASMPEALILSVIVFLLALAAAWIGLEMGKGEAAR